MIEEVFKNEEGTVIIDRNLDNFLPLRNLGSGTSRPASPAPRSNQGEGSLSSSGNAGSQGGR